MTMVKFAEFLLKSKMPITEVSKATDINRTELSLYAHGHRDLSVDNQDKLKCFINDYIAQWQQ